MAKRYPENHFIGLGIGTGIALFSGIGVPLGISLGIPSLMVVLPALGIALGLITGAAIESKYKKKGQIEPMTKEEKQFQVKGVIIGLIIFCIGLAVFMIRLL